MKADCCHASLVFVTAFETRGAMQGFLSQISWETEVWIAENPDHLIHFNGERFLGPYPDVLGAGPK
ncbi:MAG: BsuBI/PstI family type II restriction endonuclease [Verrucomicrobiota bacterium]